MKRPLVGLSLLFLADLAVAVMVVWTWVLFAEINMGAESRIEHMVAFTAHRPFVARALVPLMVRAGDVVMPDLGPLPETPIFAATLLAYTGPFIPTPPRQGLLVFIFSVGFVLLAIRSGRRILDAEAGTLNQVMKSVLAWGLALMLLLLMDARGIWGRHRIGTLYDPATLGLVALALAMLAERRWRRYVAVFAIATLNRETAIYLLPVFCLYGWMRLERREFVALLGMQLVAFTAIRGTLHLVTMHLPAFDVAIRLAVTPIGQYVPVGWEIVGVASAAGLFVAARLSATGLSLAALVMVPAAVVGYLLAGEPGEYRVFLEIAPVAMLSVAALIPAPTPAVAATAARRPALAPDRA